MRRFVALQITLAAAVAVVAATAAAGGGNAPQLQDSASRFPIWVQLRP